MDLFLKDRPQLLMMDERTTRVGGEFASITPSVVLPGGPGGVGQLLRSSVCLSASLATPWAACHGVRSHPVPVALVASAPSRSCRRWLASPPRTCSARH